MSAYEAAGETVTAIAVLAVRAFGGDGAWKDDLIAAVIWIGAMALVFGVLFFWKFVSIPPRQLADAHNATQQAAAAHAIELAAAREELTSAQLDLLAAKEAAATHVSQPVSLVKFAQELLAVELEVDGEERGFYVWDLSLALRQAALRGMVIEGKQSFDSQPDPYLHIKPLLPISEWNDLKIVWNASDVMDGRNDLVMACSESNSSSVRYRDLHLRDVVLSRDHMKQLWPQYRGVTFRVFQEKQKRTAEREMLEAARQPDETKETE